MRPAARRVFQVLALRERHPIGREELIDLLFPDLLPDRGSSSLSKALSMARPALAPFEIIGADRNVVWLNCVIEVDAERHRSMLLRALATPPGDDRDAAMVAGLEEGGRLLDD